jgi:hypothetical protein
MKNLLRGQKLLELRTVREIAECNEEEVGECAESPMSKGVPNGIIIAFAYDRVFHLRAQTCSPEMEEFDGAALGECELREFVVLYNERMFSYSLPE